MEKKLNSTTKEFLTKLQELCSRYSVSLEGSDERGVFLYSEDDWINFQFKDMKELRNKIADA